MTTKRVTVEIIRGVGGFCVSINDRRIAGPKPYGGGTVVASFSADPDGIAEALREPATPVNYLIGSGTNRRGPK